MNEQELYKAISFIDDDLITEADIKPSVRNKQKPFISKSQIRAISSIAAAAVITVGSVAFYNAHKPSDLRNDYSDTHSDYSGDNHENNPSDSANSTTEADISEQQNTTDSNYNATENKVGSTDSEKNNNSDGTTPAQPSGNDENNETVSNTEHDSNPPQSTQTPQQTTPDNGQGNNETTPPVQQTTPDNGHVNSETDPPPHQTEGIQYEKFSRDYPYYGTIPDLTAKANQVFGGKVNNISFAMMDMRTMQPLKNGEDSQWAMLFTIYEIEAEEVYAGSPTIVKLRIEGGIPNRYEMEQTSLLGNERIPVMEDAPVLNIGTKYVFALYHADGAEYSSILNPMQSIYNENNEQSGGFSASEIISYYS